MQFNDHIVMGNLKKKLKLAILFSGQVREIDPELFNQGLKLFTQDIDADIYISCWSELGKSMNHKIDNIHKVDDRIRLEGFLTKAFQNQDIKKINIESYENWWNKQSSKVKRIQDDDEFSYITKNSVAQLYKISDSYKMIDNPADYDVLVRARFDSIFIKPFKDYKKIKKNVIYNINFGKAYYPNRIYDIFFFSTPGRGENVFNCWERLSDYVYSEFNNGLERRDACRLLFNAAKVNLVDVESVDIRFADVYRGEGYLKYLSKLHLWGSKNYSNNLLIPNDKKYLAVKFMHKYKLLSIYMKYIYILRWKILSYTQRKLR